MSAINDSLAAQPAMRRTEGQVRPVTSARFDLLMMVLAIWFVGGLFLDGWAHTHRQLESFFTPWHLVLYSGFLVNATALFVVWLRNIRKGFTFWQAVPAGYELSAIGAVIFGIGGVFDMIWHTLLGIEVSLEALVSPAHLVLGLGVILIVNGPFRAAWSRPNPATKSVITYMPMLLSMMFTFSILTFFTFPFHPFVNQFADDYYYANGQNEPMVMLGLAQVLLQTAFMMGVILIAIRRWQLPAGSITFVLTLNALLLSIVTQRLTYVPCAIIAGIAADVMIAAWKPSIKNPVKLRLFAFIVPAVQYAVYFPLLNREIGLGWSVPFWTGAIVLAGVVGLLLSYVMLPSPGMMVEAE